MKGKVFIATSFDGYIAKKDGDISWLEECLDASADMGDDADMGFAEFLAPIDVIVMGRKTMEKIASFKLSPEQWPYGKRAVYVLSSTVYELPEHFPPQVKLFNRSLPELFVKLELNGFNEVYLDGGRVIQGALALNRIDEMIVTKMPLALGEGIPLLKNLHKDQCLKFDTVKLFPNGALQMKMKVKKWELNEV